jgi:hypothetical protein
MGLTTSHPPSRDYTFVVISIDEKTYLRICGSIVDCYLADHNLTVPKTAMRDIKRSRVVFERGNFRFSLQCKETIGRRDLIA